MRTKQELQEELIRLDKRARSLKTKLAQRKTWDLWRDTERELWMLLTEEARLLGPHSVKATVRRWYAGCEDVLLDTPYGPAWVSICNDTAAKSWYPGTCCIEYSEGQEVILECDFEVKGDGERMAIVVVPGHVTGGRVNEAQYAELDKRTDLAFFKHSSGGMTGLFASPKGGSRE